jgi:hypothetical protein
MLSAAIKAENLGDGYDLPMAYQEEMQAGQDSGDRPQRHQTSRYDVLLLAAIGCPSNAAMAAARRPPAAAHTLRVCARKQGLVAASAADGVGDMRADNAEITKNMVVEGGKLAYGSALFAKTLNFLNYSHFYGLLC